MPAPPKLLVVAGGTADVASVRHRLLNYRPLLEADGVDVAWAEYRGDRAGSALASAAERVRFLADVARKAVGRDVVLVQKVLLPAGLLRRWSRGGKRVVYDFDDALFAPVVTGETEAQARRRRGRLEAVLGAVDAVVAGSPPLAAYARERCAEVHVLYPSLDRSRFAEAGEGGVGAEGGADGAEARTLGWIGGPGSHGYLLALAPVLAQAFRRWPDLTLKLCTSSVPDFTSEVKDRTELIPWSLAAEVQAARAFDVAVSPMGDDEWSRARGGRVSVLLSLAAATPVVAGRGGGLEELVEEPGRGILFADTPDQWLTHLGRLLEDREFRRQVGDAGRTVIDARIWADVQYPEFRRAVLEGG